MRIVLGVAAAALVSSFLSQQMGLSPDGVAIYLGFLLGLTVVLVAFELPGLLRCSPGCWSSPRSSC